MTDPRTSLRGPEEEKIQVKHDPLIELSMFQNFCLIDDGDPGDAQLIES